VSDIVATDAPVVALGLPALDEWDNVNALAGGCGLAQEPRGDREIGSMDHPVNPMVCSTRSRDLISSGAWNVFSVETAFGRLAECISGFGPCAR